MLPTQATRVPNNQAWNGMSAASGDPGDTEPPRELGDMASDEFRIQLHRVADWVADYRETIEARRIVPQVQPGDVTRGLSVAPPDTAESMDRILSDLDSVVMPGIVHWGHPAFLGYFGSTSNGPALIGEIVSAALNVSAMTWRTSPAATELETVVLSWIRQMVGLPAVFTGVVYDTASVGVLHALAAAREIAGADIRERGLAGRDDLPVFRVYASDQAHSSLDKAMIVLGLGESNVVRIPSDDAFRMDVSALRARLQEDVTRGYKPMAVIATVGTTSTTSIDPVTGIAAQCREFGAWLHVDAAYGAALAVLPERRDVMAGVELADSVVINPHKWLFVPLDFSTLYTRHPEVLRSVFSLVPEYLRGDSSGERKGNDDSAAIDYMDYSLQLGRRFRALKAWMVFRAFGRNGMAARIREQCRLAQLFAHWVEADPVFQLMAPVPMAVVCLRFAPAGIGPEECDQLNERIVDTVNASGDAYLTHTRLKGRVAIRIGIGNVLTEERHIAHVWESVRCAATGALSATGSEAE